MTWHPDPSPAGRWPPAVGNGAPAVPRTVRRVVEEPTMAVPGMAVRGVPAPASFWTASGESGGATAVAASGSAAGGGGASRRSVADELYLTAHDFREDRARVDPREPLGILLAGGLLADLALARKVVVDGGEVRVTDEGPMWDPLAHRLIAVTLADADALRRVEDWLDAVGKVDDPPLRELIAQRLVADGQLRAINRRSARVKYQPVTLTDADWPANRIAYAVDTDAALEGHDRLLAGLLVAAGLGRVILPAASEKAVGALRAHAEDLPEHLTGVISGVRVLLSKRVYSRTH
ncbi:GPP34 family phosphoprotein [Cryptosporangium sp. NPDC048952]|uniref:GPP34 family phosphoprotein n=1 Tax=Cryptosporangium sp. NPDC048952 TaxID=3363961 RepID=UPI0037138CE0